MRHSLSKDSECHSRCAIRHQRKRVWSREQRAFFDVRVFDPNARSYQNQSLSQAYRKNELEKKRHYNERVREIEHGTFTPLVFSVYGGMGQECNVFYKRLCSLLSEKRGENYSIVSSWVRTRTSFSLLRSALMAIFGHKMPKNENFKNFRSECLNIILKFILTNFGVNLGIFGQVL